MTDKIEKIGCGMWIDGCDLDGTYIECQCGDFNGKALCKYCKKAFAFGKELGLQEGFNRKIDWDLREEIVKAEMLEEVKKDIDKLEFPNENVEHLRGFRDCKFKVKQNLENLNHSVPEDTSKSLESFRHCPYCGAKLVTEGKAMIMLKKDPSSINNDTPPQKNLEGSEVADGVKVKDPLSTKEASKE